MAPTRVHCVALLLVALSVQCVNLVNAQDAAAQIHADGAPQTDPDAPSWVPELAPETIPDVLTGSVSVLFMEFYVPWCNPCMAFTLVYESFAETVLQEQGLRDRVAFGKVDCTVHIDYCNEVGAVTFPTILVYRADSPNYPREYTGVRESPALLQEARKQLSPMYRPGADPVVDLRSKMELDAFVDANPVAVIGFSAPWCKGCRNLRREFRNAARIFMEHKFDGKFAIIDAEQLRDIADRYEVQVLPTIVIHHPEGYRHYDGPQEARVLAAYVERQALPSLTVLQTRDDAVRFIHQLDGPAVIAFLEDINDPVRGGAFFEAARNLRDEHRFGLARLDLAGANAINVKCLEDCMVLFHAPVLRTRFEAPYKMTSLRPSNVTADTVVKFVKAHRRTLAHPLTPGRATSWIPFPYMLVIFDMDFSNKGARLKANDPYDMAYKRSSAMHGMVAAVAKKFQTRGLSFALGNTSDWQFLLDRLRLDSQAAIHVVIVDRDSEHYVMPLDMIEDFGADMLESFARDFLSRSLQPSRRSQVPPDVNDGPVFTAVGSTFNSIVLGSKQDVLLGIVAGEWCVRCAGVVKAFNTLAKALSRMKSAPLKLVLIDAEHNDVPQMFLFHEVPAVYLHRLSDREHPVLLDAPGSPVTLEALIKFLQRHTQLKLRAPKKDSN